MTRCLSPSAHDVQQRAGRLETTLDRLGATSILCVDSPHEPVASDAPWTVQFEPLRARALRCP